MNEIIGRLDRDWFLYLRKLINKKGIQELIVSESCHPSLMARIETNLAEIEVSLSDNLSIEWYLMIITRGHHYSISGKRYR